MLFGCDLHEKPFCEHTEDEHLECGHVKIREGRWMTEEEIERRFLTEEDGDTVAPVREFDAGVIPDLNDDVGEKLWKGTRQEVARRSRARSSPIRPNLKIT